MLDGNKTVWHPSTEGTLNGATPVADGSCPAGTTLDTADFPPSGKTAMPAGFPGEMDVCLLASRYSTDGSTLTLTNDNVYKIAHTGGGTIIGDGDASGKSPATAVSVDLVIEPGTMVLGGTQEALIVTRGSTTHVNGTAENPVEMNSMATWKPWVLGSDGLGLRREWGGFVVTGFAEANSCINVGTCDNIVEGTIPTIRYGGTDNDVERRLDHLPRSSATRATTWTTTATT